MGNSCTRNAATGVRQPVPKKRECRRNSASSLSACGTDDNVSRADSDSNVVRPWKSIPEVRPDDDNSLYATCPKPITIIDWMRQLRENNMVTLLEQYSPKKSAKFPQNTTIPASYYIYLVSNGHMDLTEKLGVNVQALLVDYMQSGACQDKIHTDYVIYELLAQTNYLVLCLRKSWVSILEQAGPLRQLDQDVLKNNLVGLCIAQLQRDSLYVKLLCSDSNQGAKILGALESLSWGRQIQAFGSTYKKIGLQPVDEALGFYLKLGYQPCNQSNVQANPPQYCKPVDAIITKGGATPRHEYAQRGSKRYRVHTGPKQGKYIVVAGRKVYLRAFERDT